MILNTQKDSRSKFEKDFLAAESTIKGVYSEVPNWEMVIPCLMDVGVEDLPKKCFLTPGWF